MSNINIQSMPAIPEYIKIEYKKIIGLNEFTPRTIFYKAVYQLINSVSREDELSFRDCNTILKQLTNLL